jgi:hypothetical protein
MSTLNTGVLPCFKNTFRVGEDKETATMIADCETFGVEVETELDEWKPYDTQGKTRRMVVLTGVKVTVSAKRNIGDVGNNFVASKAWKTGRDVEAYFEFTLPSGLTVEMPNAVVQVKNVGTGDSTKAAVLEFDILSNGDFTPTEGTATE